MKHPDFNEWIKLEDGTKCMQWPISEPKYLQNRLFWAFDAGRNCVWDQYIEQKEKSKRLQLTIEYYEKRLQRVKAELQEKDRLLR